MTNKPLCYYIIQDCGDGSAEFKLFKTIEAAEKAIELENELEFNNLSDGPRPLYKGEIRNALTLKQTIERYKQDA